MIVSIRALRRHNMYNDRIVVVLWGIRSDVLSLSGQYLRSPNKETVQISTAEHCDRYG